jgi:hypothetical protein
MSSDTDDISHKLESLTLQLHVLIRTDLGNTEEADNIREQMAELWRDLLPEKRLILDNISGDLFMLIDDEILESGEEVSQDDFFKAWTNKDFVKVLVALRNEGLKKILPKADVAYYRGCCLLCLGYDESALVFLEYSKYLRNHTSSENSDDEFNAFLKRVEQSIVQLRKLADKAEEKNPGFKEKLHSDLFSKEASIFNAIDSGSVIEYIDPKKD